MSALPPWVRIIIALAGVVVIVVQLWVQLFGSGKTEPLLIVVAGLMMAVVKPEDIDRLNPWSRGR